MLKQRIITALALLPLVGLVLFALDLSAFAGVLLLVNYGLAWEFAKLSGINQRVIQSFYALSVCLLCLGIWWLCPSLEFWPAHFWLFEWRNEAPLITYWIALLTWLFAILLVIFSDRLRFLWSNGPWMRLALGVILIAGFWISLISIRSTNIQMEPLRGSWLVLFMFCLIWGADIGGYLFGKLFGKNKLAPKVSPGKTWEGLAGGAFLSTIVAFIGAYLLRLPVDPWFAFTLAIITLVIISVFGDLFESLLKRQVNLKDSSQLLPGHGGLMDRLDSSLAVAPCFLLVAQWLGWN